MSLTISYQNEKKRIFVEDEECVVLSFSSGCNLELWESSSDNVISFSTDYTDIMSSGKSLLCSATISYNKIRIIVLDTFSIMEETLVLERKVRVEKGADGYGMRIRTKASFLPDSCLHFQNCKFFAPPELFDKNDINGGIKGFHGLAVLVAIDHSDDGAIYVKKILNLNKSISRAEAQSISTEFYTYQNMRQVN